MRQMSIPSDILKATVSPKMPLLYAKLFCPDLLVINGFVILAQVGHNGNALKAFNALVEKKKRGDITSLSQ